MSLNSSFKLMCQKVKNICMCFSWMCEHHKKQFSLCFFFITKQCVNYSGNFFVFLCSCCSCLLIKTTCFCEGTDEREKQTWNESISVFVNLCCLWETNLKTRRISYIQPGTHRTPTPLFLLLFSYKLMTVPWNNIFPMRDNQKTVKNPLSLGSPWTKLSPDFLHVYLVLLSGVPGTQTLYSFFWTLDKRNRFVDGTIRRESIPNEHPQIDISAFASHHAQNSNKTYFTNIPHHKHMTTMYIFNTQHHSVWRKTDFTSPDPCTQKWTQQIFTKIPPSPKKVHSMEKVPPCPGSLIATDFDIFCNSQFEDVSELRWCCQYNFS